MIRFNLPQIRPAVATPVLRLPGGPIANSFLSQTPQTTMAALDFARLKPMPANVAANTNLGWNYATGQVTQPLTAAQRAAVTIPPINLPALVKTQPVIPVAPQQIKPGLGLPNQKYNWSRTTPVAVPVPPRLAQPSVRR